ncbi:MAG: hypothetical protein J4G14_02490 [Dehalococcoidia bacterium]|nr:hypothetical protein [Dehalococcoidia bacterium]
MAETDDILKDPALGGSAIDSNTGRVDQAEEADEEDPAGQQGRGAMSLEGLAHIYENNAYNPSKELLDMSGDLYQVSAKANITARERDLIMRLVSNIQLERTGRLDEEELILAFIALGTGIGGERAKDVVTIATGALRQMQEGMGAMGRGVRGMYDRARRW